MNPFLIFLVDDDPIFLKVLETQFTERAHHIIKTFSTGEECLRNLSKKPDLIFLDYYLHPEDPSLNGLIILDKIKAADPEIQVIMLSSQDQIEVAVNCMKHEAFDYIIKSEATFMRAQKAITVLFNQRKLEKEVVFYRTSAATLEKMVVERTREVVEQRLLIEDKHKEITDSINYAVHIQKSLLPSESFLSENLKDYFVFYEPKDVVSGDFYWANRLSNGNIALLTGDSTGHGVPGAIMSILNISCIEKAIEAEKLIEPYEILNHTRTKIIETLRRDGSADGGKDGMDCSLISFDFKNSTLTYAAANNPIWIVRSLDEEHNKKEILEFAPNSMPIGKHDNDNTQFSQHTIHLKKGDVVYGITDGMADQFGGPKGKKFMKKRLKELLMAISHLAMPIQRDRLSNTFNNWKADLEQVDDVTIVGVRI
ncbi:MAG: SpoIIE family protein phosphatase [Bacteroidota bacterium]|nr:SpoIIE family protein phosphatase [Bacteroidota bacterium]